MLYQTGLFLHIVGIFIAGGGSIGSLLTEKMMWKKVQMHAKDAENFLPIIKTASSLILVGMILFMVSGLLMLYAVNWSFFGYHWFTAKLLLFVLLPIRGAMIGKKTFVQIGNLVQAKNGEEVFDLPKLMALKAKMKWFHFIQYAIVITIMLLVIFKIKF